MPIELCLNRLKLLTYNFARFEEKVEVGVANNIRK